MAIEVFNRYEHKYVIEKETFEKVINVLDEYMNIDSYNKDYVPYTISNIYYDTPDDYLIRNSLSKPVYKEKLRLRSYGVPDEDSKVFLEIKGDESFETQISKQSTVIGTQSAGGMGFGMGFGRTPNAQ